MSKDWANKMKKKGSAASEFLKPFAVGAGIGGTEASTEASTVSSPAGPQSEAQSLQEQEKVQHPVPERKPAPEPEVELEQAPVAIPDDLAEEELLTAPNTPSARQGDYIDSLLGGQSSKNELTLTGVYLQKDVLRVLNGLSRKGGRGAKSRIVNDALRKLFQEKGLL